MMISMKFYNNFSTICKEDDDNNNKYNKHIPP